MKQKYLWKSMRYGLKSSHGNVNWTPGEWHKVKGKLRMCYKGYHASELIIDAMFYVPTETLAKVEVRGDSIIQDDKQCWREMRVIEAWKWTKRDRVALAIYAASLVLHPFEQRCPKDMRPRLAIQAAKRWLRNPTDGNRRAAIGAANNAYHAVADVAGASAAARAAACAAYATNDASYTAVYAANYAAQAATRKEVRSKIQAWIKRRIKNLADPSHLTSW